MRSFLVFTDYCIYWIHRWLHIPFIYKVLHKPHHKWLSEFIFSLFFYTSLTYTVVPTPFASHAFHPVDGYLQSVPYHLFIFLFPLHRMLYLGLFVAVNFWSIFVSCIQLVNAPILKPIVRFMIRIWLLVTPLKRSLMVLPTIRCIISISHAIMDRYALQLSISTFFYSQVSSTSRGQTVLGDHTVTLNLL